VELEPLKAATRQRLAAAGQGELDLGWARLQLAAAADHRLADGLPG
jgi:hypothetical protein